MNTKSFGRVNIKNEDRGEVEAVFSTFNVVDADGDVTLPDAFESGVVVPISAYGHQSWMGALPVGKGRIKVTSTEAVLDGRFFLNTGTGRDTFETVKELAAEGLGDWSYGYDVIDSDRGEYSGETVRFLKRLKVNEVSPVLVGAGVNTRTLATKAADNPNREVTVDAVEFKAAIRPHATAVTARDWDADAVTAGIADDASVSDLRTVFAWLRPDSDPENKTSYGFPHHHGVSGPANVRALTTGIAILNGARGGTNMSDADRRGVYEHLAKHLRDADREPPELRAVEGDGRLKLHEEAIAALAGVDDYLQSAERVVALRAEKGKALSHINLEALEWVGEDLRRVLTKHAELVARLRNTPSEAAAVEHVRWIAQNMRRRAS